MDCTLGLGGHSEKLLEKVGSKGKLIAFEADEENLKKAKERLKKHKNQITFIHKNFVHLQRETESRNITNIKCILFDLGLSSTQLDSGNKGFSFKEDGPLDMRFDKSGGITAEEVLRKYSVKKLEQIFREYGEERYARRIAELIKNGPPIKTAKELADLIDYNTPRHKKNRIHPATRVFQALRIEVNDELNVLKTALEQAINVLAKGGRLIVISYHSLEDRIVKRTFKTATRECICPIEIPVCVCNHVPDLKILTKKPITPDEDEIRTNPRARSAKMRVAEKL